MTLVIPNDNSSCSHILGKDTYFLTQIVNNISPSCDLRENLFSKVIDSP